MTGGRTKIEERHGGTTSRCVSPLIVSAEAAVSTPLHLDHAVPPVFEQRIGLLDAAEGVGVGDEGQGVQLALCDEAQGLSAVAAVHTAGLEGQIFAVHIRQREGLRLVVERHHRHDGVPLVEQHRLGLVRQRKFSLCNICISLHCVILRFLKIHFGTALRHGGPSALLLSYHGSPQSTSAAGQVSASALSAAGVGG